MTFGMAAAGRPRRGAILVGVLWIAILLAGLAVTLRVHMSSVAASVRMTEEKSATRAIVDAGLALAAAQVRAAFTSSDQPPDSFSRQSVELQAGTVSVALTNEALRVDINKAPRELVQGALQAAGATPAQAAALTDRFIDLRTGLSPDSPGPLQSIDEAAAVDGMPAAVAIALARSATVSSGLTGIRLDTASDDLLRAIPGLPRATVEAILGWRAGRVSREIVDQEIASSPLHTTAISPVWRVKIEVELPSGHTEAQHALLFIGEGDDAPYRVLDWRRGTDETD